MKYTAKCLSLLFSILLLCSTTSFGQNDIQVTGKVIDENKEPLIGASVIVRNTGGLGIITNGQGEFHIKAQAYKTLIFSYIGYQSQEKVIKPTDNVSSLVINVQLKPNRENSLDEVVVTGLGAQKKLTVTGAVTNVDVEQLRDNPAAANLSNALAGYVPGVMAMQTSGQPGRSTSDFWIRGISTFGANSSALVLVDGFERSLDEVNIDDVQSFSVLKDASATAIYGPRGANGVILITTKHGAAGKLNVSGKLEGSYNTRTITPKFVDGYTYAKMMNEANVTRDNPPMYSPSELELLRNHLDNDLYPNVDWKKVLLKNGAPTYRASLNLSGGGTSARYYVSASFLDEKGMYKTDDQISKNYNTNPNHRRFNYRVNVDMDLSKTTLLQVGVSGSREKSSAPGQGDNVWHALIGTNPIVVPLIYSNGYIPSFGSQDERSNPWVLATQTGYVEKWNNQIQTNVTLNQDLKFITPGLKFTGRYGYDSNSSHSISRIMMPEMWRALRTRDANGQLVFQQQRAEEKMTQSSNSNGDTRDFVEAYLDYNRSIHGNNLGGTLKFSYDCYTTTVGIGTDVKNGISRKHLGYSGRAYYNWKYRYFIDFNFGYNGSENFADHHRFGFFPAFSGAWNIGEEPFVKKSLPWLEMFKIRASYGKVGNDVMNERFPYLYTIGNGTTWQFSDDGYDNSYTGLTYTQLASNNVTWEVAKKLDIGLDLSLFSDVFSLTIDYFHEIRDGIYMQRQYLPGIVGVTSNPKANVGSVKNEGFDGNFAFNKELGNLSVTVRGNITYSNNKILEYDEPNAVYQYQLKKGHRVNQATGLIATGLFKDYEDIRNSPKQTFGTYQPGDIKYADVNGDGVIDNNDIVAIGSTTKPNLIYGFGFTVKWKGLDVNMHFQGAGKSSFFISGPTVYAFNEFQWGNILKDFADSNRWISASISGNPSTEDPNADYPRLSFGGNSNNYRNSTFWLRNGRYLRLKNVDLGYSLPKKFINKLHIEKLRFYVVGTNLLTWAPFKAWDPELASSTGEEYPLDRKSVV